MPASRMRATSWCRRACAPMRIDWLNTQRRPLSRTLRRAPWPVGTAPCAVETGTSGLTTTASEAPSASATSRCATEPRPPSR